MILYPCHGESMKRAKAISTVPNYYISSNGVEINYEAWEIMRTAIHNVSAHYFLILLAGDNNSVATKFFDDTSRLHLGTVTHTASRDQGNQDGIVVFKIPNGVTDIYMEITAKNGASFVRYMLV